MEGSGDETIELLGVRVLVFSTSGMGQVHLLSPMQLCSIIIIHSFIQSWLYPQLQLFN